LLAQARKEPLTLVQKLRAQTQLNKVNPLLLVKQPKHVQPKRKLADQLLGLDNFSAIQTWGAAVFKAFIPVNLQMVRISKRAYRRLLVVRLLLVAVSMGFCLGVLLLLHL